MRLLASLLPKASLAFQGSAISKEVGLQLHFGHKLLLQGPGHRLRLQYFLLEVTPMEAKKKWVFGDSGGLLHFLVMYFPDC